MTIDRLRVQTSVDGLRAADLADGELSAALRQVIDATCVIFEASGAGLMLLNDQQALNYVGATDARSAAFEAAQEESGEGPCVDSLIHDRVVHTDDLLADERWPAITAAIGPIGIRAILGVPIHLGGNAIGSLNVYRDEPSPWDDSEIAAISAHARVIEELIAAAMIAAERHTIVQQLTRALENRVVIERAVGVVMARLGLDPVRAFNELRRMARASRRRVADVASEVLADPGFGPGAGLLVEQRPAPQPVDGSDPGGRR